MGLRALIFDVDGTLSETEENHREAFNRAFAKAGLDWHWDKPLYTELLQVTGGKERIIHYAETHHPDGADDFVRCGLLADVHRNKTQIYGELLRSGRVCLRTGIARLIRQAHTEGLKLGLATTSTVSAIESLLDVTLGPRSIGLFDAIAAGDMAKNKKPAPDVYNIAVEMLGVEALECMAFEDSTHGLRSALDAGLKTIVTPGAYIKGDRFDGALVIVSSLGDPGKPSRVISGPPLRGEYVDVAQLRAWFEQSRLRESTEAARA